MQKTFRIVLFSSLLGVTLAGLFFFNVKEKAEAKQKNYLYAFQVGVFKTLDNANQFKTRFNGSIIVKDNDYYRIFVGITKNNKELLEKIFKDLEYDYYIKEVEVSEEVINNIIKYDEILKLSEEENKLEIINKMLGSYLNELQN